MELSKDAALIEAILLLESDPVELRKLSSISGLSTEATQEALEQLRQGLEADCHGLEIVEIGGGFAFAPRKSLWEKLRERYGKSSENHLSKAALETLAIIAYSQPITRAEIESIRGVSADGMIRLLIARNFIREVGKKDAPGKPVQYGTTREFLKAFRLSTISDLPKLEGLERERFEQE
ncbi:MAG TPA: SMC-Scp complex subunit ScpB [Spirochaetia bacterium]|nr:SMC-Scp complex subunit ScpB [Spirochaetia bacterium]